MLTKLIGRRYATLEELKTDMEALTGKKVASIMESETERLSDGDEMIDYEWEHSEVYTLFYLPDNAGRYYITEV